jgi:hypothetical protein
MVHPSNPALLAALSLVTFLTVAGFTTTSSPARHIGLAFMAAYVLVILAGPSQRMWFSHPIYPNLAGGTTFSMLLQYIDTILLQGWSFEGRTPKSTAVVTHSSKEPIPNPKQNRKNTTWDRIKFSLDLCFNKRQLGTPWQARNIPPFDKQNPQRIPSRKEFLFRNSLKCFVYLLLLDLFGISGQDTSRNHIIFHPTLVPVLTRLPAVSIEEVFVRAVSSLITSLSTYLLFQAVYTSSAVLMVGLQLNDVDSWPPLFGDFGNLTSLRGVWK